MKPKRPTARPARPPAEAVGQAQPDWLDEVRSCCHAIETLSGLLRGYGDDELEGELARSVGNMFDLEVQQLKIDLTALEAAR